MHIDVSLVFLASPNVGKVRWYTYATLLLINIITIILDPSLLCDCIFVDMVTWLTLVIVL